MFREEEPDGIVGADILYQTFKKYPEATIVTGAPVSNLWNMLQKYPDIKVKRWVAQGGFAGDNIVPTEHRLPKFRGKIVCDTYNFGGDPTAAEGCLQSDRIETKWLVSKNVCHGVFYDKRFHELLKQGGGEENTKKRRKVQRFENDDGFYGKEDQCERKKSDA